MATPPIMVIVINTREESDAISAAEQFRFIIGADFIGGVA